MNQKKFIKGFIAIFSGSGLKTIITLFLTPLLVRFLGSSLYGDYAFMTSITAILLIFLNAGINDGIRKYVSEKRDIEDWSDRVFSYYTQIGTTLIIIGSVSIILINTIGLTERILAPRFVKYTYYIIGILICRQLFSIFRSSLMGKSLEHISESMNVMRRFLFAISAIYLTYSGYGVIGVLQAEVFSHATILIVSIPYILREYNIKYLFRLPDTNFPKKELLKFNYLSIMLLLFAESLLQVDILLLGTLVGSAKTGYYKAALQIAEFLWFIPKVIQTTLLHTISKDWSNNNISEISQISSKLMRYNILITALLSIGLFVLAEPFVVFYYGENFTPTIRPLLILIPGAIGFGLSRPLFSIGQAKGDLRVVLIATGIAAILNLLLNILLIPEFGMIGAAIATSIAYGFMFISHVIAAKVIGYNPFQDFRPMKIVVTTIATIVLTVTLKQLIDSSFISLLIVPPVTTVIFLSFALWFRAIDIEELGDLKRSI